MATNRFISAVFMLSALHAVTMSCAAATSAHHHDKLTASEPPARFGLHGMLLFSDGQQLFASHLPMFHAPHDVQMVMRIELQDSSQQQALIEQLNITPTKYWTLEPELFDLNRLSTHHPAKLRVFKAKLYQGHFERGGQFMFESHVKVQGVDWFYPLQPSESAVSQFQRLSQQAQQCVYLYRIRQKPSFDQVLLVKAPVAMGQMQCPALIDVPANPQAAAAAVRQQLGADISSVYLEIGDLQ